MEGLSGGGSGNGLDMFAKIGPLPAWAWGAIAVAGYLFWSHRQSAATATVPVAGDGTVDTTDTSGVPDVSTSNDYGYDSLVDPSSAGYDYGSVNAGAYTGTVTGTAYSSNQAWAVAAIQQLVSAGIPASTAASGITHYLSGATLTADEGNAVNLAITLLGPPPLPMPVNVSGGSTATQPVPATTDTTPTTTQQPAPAPQQGTGISPSQAVAALAAYISGTGPQPSFFSLLDVTTQAQVMSQKAGYAVTKQALISQGKTANANALASAWAAADMASGQNSLKVTGVQSTGYQAGSTYFGLNGGYTYS